MAGIDDVPGFIRDMSTEQLQKLRRDIETGPQSDGSHHALEAIDEELAERGVSPKLH